MFGSFFNKMFHDSKQPEPAVGMGATILSWSDRYAATIVAIKLGAEGKVTEVTVVEDIATRVDSNGRSENQQWEYVRDPNGRKQVFTLRSNDTWVRKGDPASDGLGLMVGDRKHFYDYSF